MVLSIIAWLFGVFFILIGLLVCLGGGLISGLLMLIAGILFLPPIKRLILDKKPTLSRGKITVVGSILIFISMFFFTSNDAAKSDRSEDQAVPNESAVTKKEKYITKPKPITEPQPSTEVLAKDQVIKVDDEQAKINKIMEVGITLGMTPAEYGNKFNKLAKRASLKETVWNDVGLNLNKKEYLFLSVKNAE